MRDRRDVADEADREAGSLKRAQGRLSTGAGTLNVDLYAAHAVFLGLFSAILGSHLRCERSALSGSLEPLGTGGAPSYNVTDRVGNRYHGIVERRLYVRNAVGYVLLLFLLLYDFFSRARHYPSRILFLLASDRTSRPFPGTRIGLGALTAARKTLPVTQSPVAAEIHQTLYIHRNVAAQITLDLDILINMLSDLRHFGLGQIVAAGIVIDTGCVENPLGQRPAYTVDIGKRDLYSFILW
jgi:hypothetical protein